MSYSCGVSEFYNGKTIFITGSTGFLGKALLEKLLRSCPGIDSIYLLVRPKKGLDAQKRLQVLLSSPIFDFIRKIRPLDLQKILLIEGDVTLPKFNISLKDRSLIQKNVNIVFHAAATVKLDENLKPSVTQNLVGIQRLVEICKKIEHLEALVHVSTAYSNCDRNEVEEIIYPPPISPEKVVSLVENLDEDLVESLTNKMIGKRPNTYTFTKALAECWLKDNKGDLPVVFIRPSIIINSLKEPFEGWVDGWTGPTGIVAGVCKGLVRTMLCDSNKIADFIPVDMVVNLTIVSPWRIRTNPTKEISVYNCCSGRRNPITWGSFVYYCNKYSRMHPNSEVLFYPNLTLTTRRYVNIFRQLIWHWLPAHVVDTYLRISSKKPLMLRAHNQLNKLNACFEYFTMNDWQFHDENVKQLASVLTDSDKKEFYFDVAEINWENYLEKYILGINKFVFKTDTSPVPKTITKVPME